MSDNQDSERSDKEQDMVNMFASVWVKVEVNEDAGASSNNDEVYVPPDEEASCDGSFGQIVYKWLEDSLHVDHSNLGSFRARLDFRQLKERTPTPAKRRQKKSKCKRFRCKQCDYVTSYKNCLEMHEIGHTEHKTFACNKCEYITKYPTSLRRHTQVKHPSSDDTPNTSFKCDHCDYVSPYKWNLNAHKRKHAADKMYKCEVCPYETAYKHNIKKHNSTHAITMPTVFKCDKCPFVTKFEGHITRHMAKIHNEVIETAHKCEYCNFSSKFKWRLNVHRQRMKQKEPIKCRLCDFTTYYNCESKSHKICHFNELYVRKPKVSYANENPPATKDDALDDSTTSLLNLQTPNDNYHNIQSDDAAYNDTDFTTNDKHIKENRKRSDASDKYRLDPNCVDWFNIQILESDDKEKPYQCFMCNYSSKFKAAVRRHFQRHHTGTQNRPYKCCNCDFSTKTKDQIGLHNKRSKSDTELKCDTCDYTTMYKCQLVMHQKDHYAFKCESCNYTCRQNHDLQRHFWTVHMGNHLKCRFCDYKATRKDSLLCHETIHTGNKPFKCNLCDYTSVRKTLLETHLKRYHSDVKSDTKIVSESQINALKVPVSEILDRAVRAKLGLEDSDNTPLVAEEH